MSSGDSDAATAERVASARRRAEARYAFRWNFGFYIGVNILLLGIWYYVGHGFFWPVFVIGGWGIGVVANYYVAYVQSDQTWVDRETEKILSQEKGS